MIMLRIVPSPPKTYHFWDAKGTFVAMETWKIGIYDNFWLPWKHSIIPNGYFLPQMFLKSSQGTQNRKQTSEIPSRTNFMIKTSDRRLSIQRS